MGSYCRILLGLVGEYHSLKPIYHFCRTYKCWSNYFIDILHGFPPLEYVDHKELRGLNVAEMSFSMTCVYSSMVLTSA